MLADMTSTLARRERAALCDLALDLGPEVPTLCAGWDAKDLVVHLLVRERRPLATLGIVLPPLSGLTERASRSYEHRDLTALVELLRSPGWMFAVPAVDKAANTFEYLVHHEDLRRAQPDWEPRTLSAEDTDAVWEQLGRVAGLFGRKLPVPTVLHRAGTQQTIVAKKGDNPVVLTGDPVELVLFLFGRAATVGLEFEGSESAVGILRAADLGT